MAIGTRVVATLVPADGIQRDRCVNVWHIAGNPDPATDPTDVVAPFQEFYNDISSMINATVVRESGLEIACYNLEEPEPRAAYTGGISDLEDEPSGTALPQEVSVCLSMAAERLSGEDPARRRGRVYIGPLCVTAVELDFNGTARLNPDTITQLTEAAQTLTAAIGGTRALGVFSRMDDEVRPVEGGWVDNEFDIQRRRGHDPSFRTFWAAA